MKIMNKLLNVFILVISLSIFISFSKYTPEKFCGFINSNQLDSCEMFVDNYFKNINTNYLNIDNYSGKYREINDFVLYLDKLSCIDSCYSERGVMETNPPMTDVIIMYRQFDKKEKYRLRLRFETPIKSVFLRRYEK